MFFQWKLFSLPTLKNAPPAKEVVGSDPCVLENAPKHFQVFKVIKFVPIHIRCWRLSGIKEKALDLGQNFIPKF